MDAPAWIRSRGARLFALSALLAAACSSKGAANGGGGESGTGGNAGNGGGGASGTGGNAGTGGVSVCLNAGPPKGPARLRRLSAVEYRNSVRDLLPGVALPELELVQETIVNGFENNAAVQAPSTVLIEKLHENATRAAEAAAPELDRIFPCDRRVLGQAACGEKFVKGAGRLVFRRPLEADEVSRFKAQFEEARAMLDFAGARSIVLQTFLQSPQFLYRLELAEATTSQLEIASRVSYLLWQSTPDETLLAAAEAGRLGPAADVDREARRMLADPRARAMWVDFTRQWMSLDRLNSTNKDVETFPEWDMTLRDAMREEVERDIVEVLHDGDGRLETLLMSRRTWVNEGLARLYGVPAPADGQWASAELDPTQRAGLLTRPAFLATRGHAVEGSPVLRGVTVLERLLCAPPPAPPPDVNTTPPSRATSPSRTNRQRYEDHESVPLCASCHKRIDGVGFGFEAYDSIGRFRTMDQGQPVDATGTLAGTDVDGTFNGAVELSERLARSKVVQACMATQWFRFAFGRDEGSEDQCTLERLAQGFAQSGGNFRELLVQLATSEAFRTR